MATQPSSGAAAFRLERPASAALFAVSVALFVAAIAAIAAEPPPAPREFRCGMPEASIFLGALFTACISGASFGSSFLRTRVKASDRKFLLWASFASLAFLLGSITLGLIIRHVRN